MGKKLDLIGQRFGKLTVIGNAGRAKDKKALWKCKCDCGKFKIIRGSSLTQGQTKSCGCLQSEDITGQRFGRLVVIKIAGQDKWRSKLWECLCDCGATTIVKGESLKAGSTQSCGCLRKERVLKAITKHGMSATLIYHLWQTMHSRCENPNCIGYKNYGGRGIKVCDRWFKFENFFEDMGKKPEGLSLERINNNKGYSPDNCKWATRIEQSHNSRIQKNNKTGIKGVFWYERYQKYQVGIRANSRQIHLGYFANIEDARIARKEAEQKYWS